MVLFMLKKEYQRLREYFRWQHQRKKSPQKCLKESLETQSQSSSSHSFFPLKVATAVAKVVASGEKAVACLKKSIHFNPLTIQSCSSCCCQGSL
jgi:hypothetical protein